MLVMIRVEFF